MRVREAGALAEGVGRGHPAVSRGSGSPDYESQSRGDICALDGVCVGWLVLLSLASAWAK